MARSDDDCKGCKTYKTALEKATERSIFSAFLDKKNWLEPLILLSLSS
jgi:hypothetical protein